MRLPLFLHFQSSRSIAAILMAMHGLAMTALVVTPMSMVVRIGLLALVALSLVGSLRQHAWRKGQRAIVSLILHEDGEIDVVHGDGRRIATRLDPSSTILPWGMALQLRHERRRLSIFLMPDMLDADTWRHLAMLLRAGKLEAQAK